MSENKANGFLSDICTLRKDSCNTPKSETGIYIGLEHIDSGKIFLSNYGSPKEVRSSKNRFFSGDVLYGKLRPYLDKAVVAHCDGICSTDILVLKPGEQIPSWYLVGVLHTDIFINYAKQTTHGVNHPRTSWTAIRDYPCKSHSLPEQKKIAAVLFKIQKAIEVQESIIKTTQELKKSTMQHVFTYGLHGEKTKETEIGRIPESWDIQSFGKFASLHRGYDLPAQDRNNGTVLIIGSNGIVGYHNKAKIKGPGVITGRSGSIGISYYIEDDYWPLNTGLYVEDFHGNNQLYVHYFFQSFDFKKYAAGVSVPTLNRNIVHGAEIVVPKKAEQKKIAQVFQTIDQKIELHKAKKSILQDLFKTMLNKLMTGKIRV